MKKRSIGVLIVLIALRLSIQAQMYQDVDNLKIKGELNIKDNFFITTTPGNLETQKPLVVTFSSKPFGSGTLNGFKPTCKPFEASAINPNGTSGVVAYNYVADIVQLSGSWQNSSPGVLNLGLLNDDGLISVENGPGKLKLNPGCQNDVELCEGGGFTKIFNGASVGGDLDVASTAKIGGGTFTNAGMLNVNSSSNRTNAFSITNTALAGINKNVFVVAKTGNTIIGNQPGMLNTAMVNINVDGGASGTNAFDVFDKTANKVNFRVKADGGVYARYIKVNLLNFPDYVFDKSYKLRSLESLESYIQQNHHLPNVPTAREIEANHANIGELIKIQMEKIEELTLYLIEQNKLLKEIKKENSVLKQYISKNKE